MKSDYKSNMDETLENFKRWWNNEKLERPLLQIYAPMKNIEVDNNYNEWTSLAHNLDNPEKALMEFKKNCQQTYFGGEAIPQFWVNLGPGVIAVYLGSRLKIKEETIWIEERENFDYKDILNLEFNQDNKWWQLTKNLTDKIGSFSSGKFFTTITDLNGSLNNLASLRGSQSLLTDLIANPKKVKHACEKIVDIWLDCYENLYKISSKYQPGSITWMGIWFPGRGSDLQSDFSAMVSPDMFDEFVIPDIKSQADNLDQTIYHLDGPGQLDHVKHLLKIEELDGIQWVPGAGQPGVGSEKWFKLYEIIQSHGKKLVLHWMDKRKIKRVLKKISHKDLLISSIVDSQSEADQIINDSKNWVR